VPVAPRSLQVVATIHQPNSLITDHFDDWALLAKGRLLFAGPWGAALPYFEAAGHACPLYRNPTDFFMSLASNSDSLAALADAWAQQQVRRGGSGYVARKEREYQHGMPVFERTASPNAVKQQQQSLRGMCVCTGVMQDGSAWSNAPNSAACADIWAQQVRCSSCCCCAA
jgi:hypothetical protein